MPIPGDREGQRDTGPPAFPYQQLVEVLQQQVTFLQEQNALLTARLAEVISPGVNARLKAEPPPPPAERPERRATARYSPAAYARRVEIQPPDDHPDATAGRIADQRNAQIEGSFR